MPLTNKTVGVFFGGKGPEHDISVVTGLLVLDELSKMGIATVPVYISIDGAWCVGEAFRSRDFMQGIHQRDLYEYQRWSIDTRHRSPQLILTRRPHFFARRERITMDIAFPAFHGAYGEDGSFQGMCEILGVPYVGSGVTGCSLSMSKALTKRLFQSMNMPTTPFISFSAREWEENKRELLLSAGKLTYPLFVKPVHAGSSIGITRVEKADNLESSVDLALGFDTHCLIEEGVPGVRDVTCCVRERPDGSLQASFLQESRFDGSDFFSYEEKYLKGGGAQFGNATQRIIIPAELPQEIASQTTEASIRIFRTFQLSGTGRVDFLFNPASGELYANEINPMPGTLYHHLWKESGVDTPSLLEGLLLAALRMYTQTRKKNTYFPSSLLTELKGGRLSK